MKPRQSDRGAQRQRDTRDKRQQQARKPRKRKPSSCLVFFFEVGPSCELERLLSLSAMSLIEVGLDQIAERVDLRALDEVL